MRKFYSTILIVASVTFIFVGGLFVFDTFSNLKIDVKTKKIVTSNIVKPVKPSYKYLKSITVYITGEVSEKKEEDDSITIGQVWGGTGSIIKIDKDYTYILTNAHVAGRDKGDRVTLFVEEGLQTKEAELVAFHKSNLVDLAVIKIEGTLKGKQAVKGFSFGSPQDSVYLVGHHLGRKYVYGEGVFAGYDRLYDIIQIPTLYGNSGSAVCNKDGELIGVIFAINGFGWGQVDVAHGLAIDGLSVKLFLKDLRLL